MSDNSGNFITGLTPITSDVSGSPYIMTMDELLGSHANILQQEAADKALLTQLSSPNKSTLQPAFVNWTTQGFPNIFILFSMTLSPPQVCADGVTRTMYDYISYLLEMDLGLQIVAFQTNFLGMLMSYTISGTTLNIHVTKQ